MRMLPARGGTRFNKHGYTTAIARSLPPRVRLNTTWELSQRLLSGMSPDAFYRIAFKPTGLPPVMWHHTTQHLEYQDHDKRIDRQPPSQQASQGPRKLEQDSAQLYPAPARRTHGTISVLTEDEDLGIERFRPTPIIEMIVSGLRAALQDARGAHQRASVTFDPLSYCNYPFSWVAAQNAHRDR